MATASTKIPQEARQQVLQRHPGSMSVEIVAAILRDLENAGFNGSVEIELRAGRMLAVHQAPLPAEKMHGGMDARNQP